MLLGKEGKEVGLGSGDVVLDGDQLNPTENGAAAPHFSVHVYCGQTAVWIRCHLVRR